MLKKKIKFYLREDAFIKISAIKNSNRSFKKTALLIAVIFFEVCYFFGHFILSAALKSFKFAKREYFQTKTSVKKKFRSFTQFKQFQNLIILFAAFFGIFVIFIFAYTIVNLSSTINAVITKSFFAKNSFLEAAVNLGNNDLDRTQISLAKANDFLDSAGSEFASLDFKTKALLKIMPIDKETSKLLELGKKASETGVELVSLGQEVKNLQISSGGIFSKSGKSLKESMDSAEKSIIKMESNLHQINKLFSELNTFAYPEKISNQVKQLQKSAFELTSNFSFFQNTFIALRSLFENSELILLVLQNNNELRPTGGFAGTLGELKINEGRITSLEIESVYEKDGQLKESIIPPTPIMNVNPKWYLRDSNWFADFPLSAKKMSEFFEKEGGETPKSIVAITPDLVIDLLKYTGPVRLEKYNLTFTADNFVELAQIETSTSELSPENKPKQLLADLFPVLLSKLNLKNEKSPGILLSVFQKNIEKRNILFYSNDINLQKKFELLGWSGQVLPAKHDYLYIVNSNLEGTKTDLFIDQKISLVSNIQSDNSIVNTLSITRTNRLPKLAKTFNNSFVRILVPRGSELISSDGFDYKILDTKSLIEGKQDMDVLSWEQSSQRNLSTGTITGIESEKTFFGNWIRVEGSESKTVTFTYKLPFKIEPQKQYSIVFQKQPGSQASKTTYSLIAKKFKPVFFTTNPDSVKNAEISYNFDLDKDKFFGTILDKR